jgi:hypothetical protein
LLGKVGVSAVHAAKVKLTATNVCFHLLHAQISCIEGKLTMAEKMAKRRKERAAAAAAKATAGKQAATGAAALDIDALAAEIEALGSSSSSPAAASAAAASKKVKKQKKKQAKQQPQQQQQQQEQEQQQQQQQHSKGTQDNIDISAEAADHLSDILRKASLDELLRLYHMAPVYLDALEEEMKAEKEATSGNC